MKSIFVNIFGGITRVDEVAKGDHRGLDRVDLNVADGASASTAPTPSRAGPSWPTTCPTA